LKKGIASSSKLADKSSKGLIGNRVSQKGNGGIPGCAIADDRRMKEETIQNATDIAV